MIPPLHYPLYAVHGDNDLAYEGWLVLTRGIGHDPSDRNGENFRRFPHRCIVRLNNGYGDQGTIPAPEHYADFAQRCAHFVEASPGCHIWIIGNEPNHAQERPDGRPITAQDYAECFTLCRDAIRALQFHSGDQVLVAAIAPWNVDTGAWLPYFDTVQFELPVGGCDGFAVHTYAREQTPESVTDTARMDPPFEMWHNGFRTYTDWMSAILPRFQGLPVYLTEFCIAGEPWQDVNTGFVQAAYAEIDGWNRLQPTRPILCAALYRWEYDQWHIDDKPNVHADFYAAVERGYTVPPIDDPDPPIGGDMKNPGFEYPYNEDSTHSTVKVAEGWTYFASSGKPPERDGPCALPEYKPLDKAQDPRRVYEGQVAQCWFIRWKVFDAGVYQRVESVVGATYRLSVMAQAWCSNKDDPEVSDGELYITLGIDPTGGTDAFAPSVAWSEWEYVGAKYQQYHSPSVLASGGNLTLFVRAWNKWELSHNDIYIDDAHLSREGDPDPPDGGEMDYDYIRRIVREEIDKTVWAVGAPS
jgi:hypothetical protein